MNLSNKSFHLRWNNHLSNLRTLLEYMYNEQSFVDVTLSCKDGLIRAHKLVLSACSPYFDSIFRENPCEHPVVILRGISLREIQLIIEYMYVGSVDIPEDELTKLLEVANELHVKGLVQDPVYEDDATGTATAAAAAATTTTTTTTTTTNTATTTTEKSEDSGSCGGSTTQPDDTKMEESEVKESLTNTSHSNEISSKEIAIQASPELSEEQKAFEESKFSSDNDDSVCGILSMAQVKMDEGVISSNEDEKLQITDTYHFAEYPGGERNCYPADQFCKICNRGFLSKQNMKRHMQTHSGLKPHQCSYCSLSFLRLSHLQRHHRVHTGERPFLCDQCDKQFSRSDKLKQHIAQHHSGVVIPKQQKQRGRPRKVPLNIPLNLAAATNSTTKITTASGMETLTVIPTYQALQQIYNIPTSVNGISVVQ